VRAKLAYLTSPKRGVYLLHLQKDGQDETEAFEITQVHLANIIIDGTAFSLRPHLDCRSEPA
jgi:hypothetical protein